MSCRDSYIDLILSKYEDRAGKSTIESGIISILINTLGFYYLGEEIFGQEQP